MPPITVYHPVFARFLQLMREEREGFTSKELNLAQNFICGALRGYSTKGERIRASGAMAQALHRQLFRTNDFPFARGYLELDGAVRSARAPNGFDTLSAIVEVKSEIGDGHSDPIVQAECDYVAIYSSDEVCDS